MEVVKRRFRSQYVHLKYIEASWPAALVAHRIEPLHGTMRALTNKRNRSDDGVQQQVPDDVYVQERCHSYKSMLYTLMGEIQNYLLLSDNNERCEALSSLALVRSTATQTDENRICIWLEDFEP